jgi:hypothetical protein
VDTDSVLVQAWDDAHDGAPWQRPLLLASALAAAVDVRGAAAEPPDRTWLLDAPVGTGVRLMLELADWWFGPAIDTFFACRSCGQPMEAGLAIRELLDGTSPIAVEPFPIITPSGDTVTVRLPSRSDLAIVAAERDVEDAVRALLERTVVDAPPEFDPVAHADIISGACEDRDPLGTVVVGVTCPACGATDEPALDVAGWFWARAEAQVRRLLDDVHVLASAYGWSERDILALGPRRRTIYRDWIA